MTFQRPLTKALTCHNCQQHLLRSFIAGVSGHSSSLPTPLPRQRRAFSRTVYRSQQDAEKVQREEEHALNDISDDFSASSHASPEKTERTNYIPWYLQVQQPIQQPENPLSSRQKIPDLPEHAPALLQPLLNHISIELGIDHLSLLDLRALDPPPALGANLLMLIGTARSEKHLHVSADRLCRWLRTEYKLSPYADGLLGRNELKLKLRRKAKRSRILSAVGAKATADTEIDDGIRTGWVCVNVGRVEGGVLLVQQEEETSDEVVGMVGFGRRTDGCCVVVQMMTEEKRGEVDLETLWMQVLRRAEKKREKEMEDEEEGERDGG